MLIKYFMKLTWYKYSKRLNKICVWLNLNHVTLFYKILYVKRQIRRNSFSLSCKKKVCIFFTFVAIEDFTNVIVCNNRFPLRIFTKLIEKNQECREFCLHTYLSVSVLEKISVCVWERERDRERKSEWEKKKEREGGGKRER